LIFVGARVHFICGQFQIDRQLLARFIGVERAARTLSGELSLQTALARTERMLSGTLGAASARVIVAASVRRGRLLTRSARAIIDEASEAIRYNYEILRNTLDHVGMGIAAFDREGRLEIFNDRFTTLLSLDDVRTLFHEFGHGLHHMLTQVNERDV
jgi:PAS domain-containing protein